MTARRAPGFTLIELLAVMAVIAVLLTLAMPRYFGSLERSKEAALRENLKVLRVTLDKYYADRGRFPESLDDLVTQKYLKAVPVDPITETASWVIVSSTEADKPGIADVRSAAQGRTSDGVPYGEL